MIINPDKCHYMCVGADTINDVLKFCDEELEASTFETVFEIEIDLNFSFEDHVETLCGKVTKNLNKLQRIANSIECSKRNPFQSIIKS